MDLSSIYIILTWFSLPDSYSLPSYQLLFAYSSRNLDMLAIYVSVSICRTKVFQRILLSRAKTSHRINGVKFWTGPPGLLRIWLEPVIWRAKFSIFFPDYTLMCLNQSRIKPEGSKEAATKGHTRLGAPSKVNKLLLRLQGICNRTTNRAFSPRAGVNSPGPPNSLIQYWIEPRSVERDERLC